MIFDVNAAYRKCVGEGGGEVDMGVDKMSTFGAVLLKKQSFITKCYKPEKVNTPLTRENNNKSVSPARARNFGGKRWTKCPPLSTPLSTPKNGAFKTVEANVTNQRKDPKMTRNRTSAKKAGTAFETLIATYLNTHIDDRIERRTKTGAKDRGDISGLRHMTQRIVIECKNTTRPSLATWATEADIERGNDDAGAYLIAHKRHGKGQPQDQWITTTLGELVALLNGNRDHLQNQ